MDEDILLGSTAQVRRAQALVREARSLPAPEGLDRAIVALHPARAALQLVRDRVVRCSRRTSRSEFDRWVNEHIPFTELIRRLRIYDSHRIGLRSQRGARLLATVKLGPYGTSTMRYSSIGDPAPTVSIEGEREGDLLSVDFLLWAPPYAQTRSGEKAVHIVDALEAYLNALVERADDLEKMLA